MRITQATVTAKKTMIKIGIRIYSILIANTSKKGERISWSKEVSIKCL